MSWQLCTVRVVDRFTCSELRKSLPSTAQYCGLCGIVACVCVFVALFFFSDGLIYVKLVNFVSRCFMAVLHPYVPQVYLCLPVIFYRCLDNRLLVCYFY